MTPAIRLSFLRKVPFLTPNADNNFIFIYSLDCNFVLNTVLNHFICNVNYMAWYAPPLPLQIQEVFQSAASTLAKLKCFDIGLKVFMFVGFEPKRKNWDLVERDCLS